MLIITPHETSVKRGNSDAVLVVDHQPHKNYTIEADYVTGTKYIDDDYNAVKEIVKYHTAKPSMIYLDHYLRWYDFPYDCNPVPLFFITSAKYFKGNVSLDTDFSDTNVCFAMMNNMRPNRLLVSSWFAHYNNGEGFDYTQSWEEGLQTDVIRQELLRCSGYEYLGRGLNKLWLPYKDAPNSNYDRFAKNNVEANREIWENVLKYKFCSSTISIVTEPVFWEKAVMITEKYLMTIYGHCFPIFCGGYGVADTLKSFGFDVFDDVINHEYQYEMHPSKRVLDALTLNRDILSKSMLKKTDYEKRHRQNKELVTDMLDNFVSQFHIPEEIYNESPIFHNFIKTA